VLRTSATLVLTAGLAGCGEHEGYGEFTEPAGTGTRTTDDGADADTVIAVGPNGEYVYEPGTKEPLYITPGTTVRFVWDSDNHNIDPRDVPPDAEWEGLLPMENRGFEYEYTFESRGTYEFQCDPHAGLGMSGVLVVESTE